MKNSRSQRTSTTSSPVANTQQRTSESNTAQKLQHAAKALGNEGIRSRIASQGASRDVLMAHIEERLTTIKAVQGREADLTSEEQQRHWWYRVSGKEAGVTKPEPKRWAEPAAIYEDAVRALCRGDLGRAKSLIQQAEAIETKLHDQTTSLVDTRDLNTEEELPDVLGQIASGEACAPCDDGGLIELAREIQAEVAEIANPPVRKRVAAPWWTEEEEEEEEEDDAGG